MAKVTATARRTVQAAPEAVTTFLSDYREARPKIVPDAFHDYRVEEGGQGAGTVFAYTLHAGRRERAYRMRVEEEIHGLRESDLDSSLVTTWTIAPGASDAQSTVRLSTSWDGASGIGGFFERAFAPTALKRIYDDTLARLAAVVER
jgi:hypothetical protein